MTTATVRGRQNTKQKVSRIQTDLLLKVRRTTSSNNPRRKHAACLLLNHLKSINNSSFHDLFTKGINCSCFFLKPDCIQSRASAFETQTHKSLPLFWLKWTSGNPEYCKLGWQWRCHGLLSPTGTSTFPRTSTDIFNSSPWATTPCFVSEHHWCWRCVFILVAFKFLVSTAHYKGLCQQILLSMWNSFWVYRLFLNILQISKMHVSSTFYMWLYGDKCRFLNYIFIHIQILKLNIKKFEYIEHIVCNYPPLKLCFIVLKIQMHDIHVYMYVVHSYPCETSISGICLCCMY